ncbi:erythromycin esterase-like protein [Neolewinella xylanilytica]|uniref:Erythromycin esterase-like protein n=1 Tax=Neolewinella xylanilytica TaxID=1514080 RepID=A0A2S6I339_9BACT|nr:erythromycin esterase family protein [Neolewinella xylanilytica]PPK85602.1 erythromycin esterase-like protein [Neolewinella xylanilytica]
MLRHLCFALAVTTTFACSEKVLDAAAATPASQSLNLGYEQDAGTDTPAEWFVVPQAGYQPYVSDAGVAYQGNRFLYFQSTFPDTSQRVVCFNSLLSDVIRDSLELSFMVKSDGGRKLRYGVYYYAHGGEAAQPPRLIQVDQTRATNWEKQTIAIPKRDLPGNILDFGLWIAGAGELWLDDWEVKADGMPYHAAVQQRIPAVTATDLAELQAAVTPLPDGPPHTWKQEPHWLSGAVGDADIVLLGEATHGTKDFTELRTQLTRYLVEEMGFITVALEASLPDVDRFNSALHSGLDQPALQERIAEDLQFWMYRTSEYLSFFEWLASTEPGKVQLRGVDMQDYAYALGVLDTELRKLKNDRLIELVDSLQRQINQAEVALPLAEKLHRELSAGDDQGEAFQRNVRYASIIRDALYWRSTAMTSSFRDSSMAANARWLQDRSPNRKLVIWANNGHTRLTGGAMGDWLKRSSNGGKVFSVGLASGQGKYLAKDYITHNMVHDDLKPAPPDSWDFYFAQMGTPNFYLDLRRSGATVSQYPDRRFRGVGAIATPHQYSPVNLADDYDAIIYLDETEAAVPYRVNTPAS